MSLDINIPVVIGGVSGLIGYILAFFVYKKFISDKYGKGKEKANKIYIWCGFLAALFIGQGLSTFTNEVLFSLMSNQAIHGGAIARGVVMLLFFPIILALFAFILSKLFYKLETNKFIDKKDVSSDPSNTQKFSFHLSQKSTIFISFIAILIIGFYFFYNSNFSFTKEKTFTLSECVNCSIDPATMQNKCQDVDNWKFFKVSLDKIQVGVHLSDALKIIEHPRDSKEKCSIIHEKNFAFTCSSFDDGGGILITSSKSFDGVGKFKSELNQLVKFNGRMITGVTTCTAK